MASKKIDIQARKLYLEFTLMNLDSDETSRDIHTAVLQGISIHFIWAEWFGLGSHFWKKNTKCQENHIFKNGHVKKSRNVDFWKKSRRRPMTPGVSYEFQLFYGNLKKWLFPQIRFFGNVFPYPDIFLLKTKMVRTVHRNILYSVDWGIRDSKRGFGRNS